MTVTLNSVAATVSTEIAAFRKSCVATENRSTPFARAVLASVVSQASTLSLIEAGIVHAFGNPKNAKGKGVDTVSKLRAFTGGEAVYQAWKSVVSIMDNLDADAPRTDDDGVTVGTGDIRNAVVGFILETKDAPKNLKQLNDAVKAAIKAHAAATSPDNSDAVAENEANAENGEISQPSTVSLKDRLTACLVMVQAGVTADDMNEAYDVLEALNAAFNAAIEADAGEVEVEGELADA